MEQSNIFLEAAKKKYNFDQWANKIKAHTGKLCKGFTPSVDKIRSFEFLFRKAQPGFHHAFTDYYKLKSDEKSVIAVSVFEFTTMAEAHNYLIQVLSTITAPLLPRLTEVRVKAGDIGFAGYQQSTPSLFFTRMNIFVHIHNVGDTEISVEKVAEEIDKQIVASQK